MSTDSPSIDSPLLSADEAAAYCRVTRRVVLQAFRDRRVSGVKCGKAVMFLRSDLDAWIAESTVKALR